MLDIQSISVALSSLKAAGEMASALKDVRDATLLQSKVFDLQREILSAQQAAISAQIGQSEMIAKIRQLEREKAELESWNQEQARYHLIDFGSGTFAYVLKDDSRNGEPSHRLCPACFQKKQKSILQFERLNHLKQEKTCCPCCKTVFDLGTPHQQDWSRSPSDNRSWRV
jgi:hypothetical protein